MCLTPFKTILLDCIVTAVISACIKKNLWKLVNFCVAILILKMKENRQCFWNIMLYYFKKGKTTETQKRIYTVYWEGAVTDWMCRSGLQSFLVLLTLWPNNSLLWGYLTHCKMPIAGDSQHTQNIQINKAIGENERCVFLFYGKKLNGLFGQRKE